MTFSGSGITVHSTTFGSATSLTANVTIDAGAATGARDITVTNPDTGTGTGTGVFSVSDTPPPATNSAFSTSPSGGTPGGLLTGQPVVQVQTAAGAVVATDETTVVSLALQGGTGALTCTDGLAKPVVHGVATFSGCSVDLAGTYTLLATSVPVLTPATSSSFGVTTAAQTITFPALTGVRLDETAPVPGATASSGLAVAYSSATTGLCTVTTGGVITLLHAGTCTIDADQAGNATYGPAPRVSRGFAIATGDQAITFDVLADRTLAESPVTISATASSLLTVSFTSNSTSVCTVAGTSVSLLAVGTCSISADQAGDADWNAAATVTRTFGVTTAARYVVVSSRYLVVAGQPTLITAQLVDPGGHPVPTAGIVVIWSATGAGGSFGSSTSTTAADGTATVVFVTSRVVGTVHIVTATTPRLATGTSAAIVTAPAPPPTPSLTPTPSPTPTPAPTPTPTSTPTTVAAPRVTLPTWISSATTPENRSGVTVVAGERVTLTMRKPLIAGLIVEIWRQFPGSPWTSIAIRRVDADGTTNYTFDALGPARYRFRFPGGQGYHDAWGPVRVVWMTRPS